MALYGPEALVNAAENAEEREDWRRAYGFWSDVISQYGNKVSKDQLNYWELHKKMCDDKMMGR